MNKRIRPVGILKQRMGRISATIKIPIGLINDQRKLVALSDTIERGDQRLGIFHTGRVVGADQCNRLCARRNQFGSLFRIRQHAVPRDQRHCFHAGYVEIHFVVKIPRHWQNDFIVLIG